MNKTITIEAVVNKNMETVWDLWTEPQHIEKWMYASDDWECPYAENDVTVGGKFLARMSAKDQSVSFDLIGTYTAVEQYMLLAYTLDDGRTVKVFFTDVPGGVHIVETFEMENENSEEKQREGWQAILDNFKRYAESR